VLLLNLHSTTANPRKNPAAPKPPAHSLHHPPPTIHPHPLTSQRASISAISTVAAVCLAPSTLRTSWPVTVAVWGGGWRVGWGVSGCIDPLSGPLMHAAVLLILLLLFTAATTNRRPLSLTQVAGHSGPVQPLSHLARQQPQGAAVQPRARPLERLEGRMGLAAVCGAHVRNQPALDYNRRG